MQAITSRGLIIIVSIYYYPWSSSFARTLPFHPSV